MSIRSALNSVINENDSKKGREVIRKVIGYMTLGMDASAVFSRCAELPSPTMKSWRRWYTSTSPHTQKIMQISPSWQSTPSKKIASTPPQRYEDSPWEIYALSNLQIMSIMSCRWFGNFSTILSRMWRRLRLWVYSKCFTFSLRRLFKIKASLIAFLFSSRTPMLWSPLTRSSLLMKF